MQQKDNYRKWKEKNYLNAKISWSDFRYAEIQHGTFEGAEIEFSDFYRAFIDGVVIFSGSSFDINVKSDWSPDAAVKARWSDAEVIYKNLNALWAGKGYFADANWAYVQGRKMERRRMISQLSDKSVKPMTKIANIWNIITNVLSAIFFGYGESMFKMILTYILTVFLFAWTFTENISLLEYTQALAISLKNMAGIDSETIRGISPLVDMLNVVQTTIGILLTGIFGFILGNKIRNQ